MERFGILVFVALALCSVGYSVEVSRKCLGCICYANTQCNFNRGCTTSAIGTKICGAFLMTKNYWIDGGRSTVEGDDAQSDQAFENCVNNARCARQTLRGYMNRYKRDCNGDGKINCEDYARIHGFGPSGCRNPSILTHTYYKAYSACRDDLTFTEED